jgi:predicted cupin superfamily sugar epimerase
MHLSTLPLFSKVHLLDNEGNYTCTLLGDGVKNPQCVYQTVIPHDTWYAAEIIEGVKYVFFGANKICLH